MKKIVISMLIVTGFSIIKVEAASTENTHLGASSNYIMALLRAGGVRGNRINAWVDALGKCSSKVGVNIKTYMASTRNPPALMVGADAVALRKAVEDNTQPIEGDVVMATFLMEGDDDSVTLHSDIHHIEVIQAADEKGWKELKAQMTDTGSVSYAQIDSCTKCAYKWKAVIEQDKLRVLCHREALCKSNFSKKVFFAALTEEQA